MSASPFVVGLTGGIGCGKSTIADHFARRGVVIVDADLIAHRLTGPGGAAIPMIQDVFGSEFIDSSGAMDRAKMRERVFSDGTAKRQLEGILHPMIRAASIAAIADAKSPYVVNVVPLLFESGRWQDKVSRTLVVDCPEEIQVARVMSRSGLDRKAVLAIMNQQVTRKERLALADDIIDNSGAPESVEAPVTRLHAQYQELAR